MQMDIANVELNIKVEATETESQDQDGTFDCEGAMLGEAEVKQERSSDGLTNGGDGEFYSFLKLLKQFELVVSKN